MVSKEWFNVFRSYPHYDFSIVMIPCFDRIQPLEEHVFDYLHVEVYVFIVSFNLEWF